jgi:hypothetical protein
LSGDVEIKPGAHNLTLNIGHIDARSLNVEDKFDEISSLVIEHKLDIFAVSETWLRLLHMMETHFTKMLTARSIFKFSHSNFACIMINHCCN